MCGTDPPGLPDGAVLKETHRGQSRPEQIGRHGGRPSSFITNAARQRPAKTLGGRCSVGAHFSRAPARPYQMGAVLRPARVGRHGLRLVDFTPRKEVIPPVLSRTRRGSAQRNPLEGDAPSAPTFPARQRGFVGDMGAGLRPAEVGRHGGRPSSFDTSAARQRPAKSLGGRCSVGAHFSRAPARLCW